MASNITDFVNSLSIGKIKNIRRYNQGLHNDTYKVDTSGGEYSLRVYNYKKPAQIHFELSLLSKLSRLDVPHPLKIDGKYIFKFNKKYAIIYPYLIGDHVKTFSKRQLNDVGEFIGKYHNSVKNFRWDKYRYQFYNLPDYKIKRFERISKEAKLKYLRLLPTIVKELKENRLDRKLPRGPIHVDIKPENVLFYKGRLSGVLDFDNSYIGPFVLDLAKSMVWFGVKNKKFNLGAAAEIYSGYVKKRKLSNLEKKELYKSVKFAFLSHVFVDYYMRAVEATTEEYFEFIINDLYAAYRNFNLSEKEFNKKFGLN